MPIRSLQQLTELLDEDLKWRKRELSFLKSQLAKANRDHEKRIMLRVAVCFLYSHWEGFIKRASTAYISFVSTRGRRFHDLTPNFVALGLRGLIISAGSSRSPVLHTDLVSKVLFGGEENANLNWTDAVNVGSNLNSRALIDVLCLLGIDATEYRTSGALIDQRLLENRNRIAHGEQGSIEPDDYEFLQERVLEIIERFRTDLQNAAVLQSYLVNPGA